MEGSPFTAAYFLYKRQHGGVCDMSRHCEQGSSQWIVLEFPQKVCVSEIHIQFQGGFSSKNCNLEGCLKNEEFETVTNFYPEDINALQKFVFTERCVEKLRLSFPSSTDFFGRIVVYHLDVRGCKL
ncbi:nuclear receptor 2C2-associated protein isoform X3 [Aquarana catesbeiana]|uniref:nuclear receptor 2C2-associated protein isoform X3 n=1 Tax=Aquarana catesbeiana TaxID=8400 RepID=UPI003CCA63A2